MSVVTVWWLVTPATTCALVRTWSVEMTKPEPSTEREQLGATPWIRTTRLLADWIPAVLTTLASGAGMARIRSAPMPLKTWA